MTRTKSVHQHSFPHKGLLPEGLHASLTWGLPEDLGSVTRELLARTNAFADCDNRHVDLVTLTPDQDIAQRERELRSQGLLRRKVRVHNLWSRLLTMSDKQLKGLIGTVAGSASHSATPLTRDGRTWTTERRSSGGKVLQIDRYRSDGTLLVSDVRDTKQRGTPGGRCIMLFDRTGACVGEWHSARAFYWAWLDTLFAGNQTYLLIDSPFVGGFMYDYSRENVATMLVLHGSYERTEANGAAGQSAEATVRSAPVPVPVLANLFQAISHLDGFALVITQDSTQAQALTIAGLTDSRMQVLPFPAANTHNDPLSVASWGTALATADFSRLRPWEKPKARLISATTGPDAIEITVNVDYVSGRIPERAYVSWKSQDRVYFGRCQGLWGICSVTARIPYSQLPAGMTVEVLVDLVGPRDFARARVTVGKGTIASAQSPVHAFSDTQGTLKLEILR